MQNEKKHVLIISPFASPNVGGVESHLDKLLKAAVSDGYYVTLMTYRPLTSDVPWEKYIKGDGYEIIRARWFGVGLFPKVEKFFPLSFIYLFPGLFFRALRYYLGNHEKVSCIHAHGLAAATIARILSTIHRKRLVLSTHAIYSFKDRPLLNLAVKKILKGFDYIMGVSEISKTELIEMGLPESKIGVHKNWVDTDIFAPSKNKKDKSWPSGINILYLGRLLDIKGIRLLCDAAKQLPNIHFHFVGAGPLIKAVESLSNELGNVHFYGVLKQADPAQFEKMINLYSFCDYFVSPYLYDEGFSASLIEAICCGTPVVIPNRGSPPTFLSDSVAIFMKPNVTVEDVVKTLKTLKAKTEAQKKACRKYALNNFGVKNAEFILDNYKE